MCGGGGLPIPSFDPVSLAISLGTTLLQSKLQNDAAKQNSRAQLAAQQKFYNDIAERRNLANQQFQDSVQQAGQEADTQRTANAVAERTALYEPKFNQRTLLPGQGDASRAVKTAIVTAQNQGIKDNADAARLFASLGAYDDAALKRDIALKQNANRIATQGGFAQGALNNLQADQNAAATAGQGKLNIADLVGGAGTLANGLYTGYRAGPATTRISQGSQTYGPLNEIIYWNGGRAY